MLIFYIIFKIKQQKWLSYTKALELLYIINTELTLNDSIFCLTLSEKFQLIKLIRIRRGGSMAYPAKNYYIITTMIIY